MFHYSLKTKLIIIVIFLALLVATIWLVKYNFSRSQDIQTIAQTKTLANALETYYAQYRAYPVSEGIGLSGIYLLSDQGLNTEGATTYWRMNRSWWREGAYISDGTKYIIQFDLKHGWQALGLKNGGGICQISSGVVLQCQSQ